MSAAPSKITFAEDITAVNALTQKLINLAYNDEIPANNTSEASILKRMSDGKFTATLNNLGKKLEDTKKGPTNTVTFDMEERTTAESALTKFIDTVAKCDDYFKYEKPHKRLLWTQYNIAMRPQNMGIPPSGGLLDFIQVANEFPTQLIQNTKDVNMSYFIPLLDKLEKYWKNLL